MGLNFPNHSRSFDPRRRRVRFWGHDNALELTFFIEEDALRALDPDMAAAASEAEFLASFDCARPRIHEVAERAYLQSRPRRYSHSLTADDF